MLDEHQTGLLTRCLWSLQEAATSIEGLLLCHVDGLMLTSTLEPDASTERLAATTTAMYLLSEQTSKASKQGASKEVFLKLSEGRPRHEADVPAVRYVYMRPVGVDAVLVAICRRDDLPDDFARYLSKAVRYLDMVLDGGTPTLPYWLD
jgi:predicted regulator of Ras-like GTPase activity (Roadblock/LC7/MglB family)